MFQISNTEVRSAGAAAFFTLISIVMMALVTLQPLTA